MRQSLAKRNRYEDLLELSRWSSGGLSSALAAASLATRLSIPADTPNKAAIRDVAAGVAAPFLVSYILWILRGATEMRLRRLYFVSRDGQILLDIARHVVSKLNMDIELRYLFGSRQSWHLAASEIENLMSFRWTLEQAEGLTLRQFLARFGLRIECFSAEAFSVGFGRGTWNRALSANELEKASTLLRFESICSAISRFAEHQRILLCRYLEQEMFYQACPSGIVDLGWTGALFSSLHRILEDVVTFPYPFVVGMVPQESLDFSYSAWLFDGPRRDALPIPRVAVALEVFCAGTHGTVLEYSLSTEGVVVPRLKTERNEGAISWGLPLLRSSIQCFLNHLELSEKWINSVGDLRDAAVDVLYMFWCHPTSSEAQAWGRFPYEDDQQSEIVGPLAQPISVGTILKSLARRRYPVPLGLWRAGGYAVTSPILVAVVRTIEGMYL